MALPKNSIRIRDLDRLETPAEIASKQEVLLPGASNGPIKDTYSIPINSLAAWLLLNYAADKDLSNLTATGQSVIDHKQDYFFDNANDSDLNMFIEDGIYKVTITGGTECHTPNNLTGYFIVSVDTAADSSVEQQARELHTNPGKIYRRQRVSGVWGSWVMITQDMSSPTFINSPTVVNEGTETDQLATINQLNNKFADVFKTELHITEGLVTSGSATYDSTNITLPTGLKYITNTSISNVLLTDVVAAVANTGIHYIFVNESKNIIVFDNFQKVLDLPETIASNTLYYIISTDAYTDGTDIYQLAPVGSVQEGTFQPTDSQQLLTINSMVSALATMGIGDKVDKQNGNEFQNSIVSTGLDYSRTIAAGKYNPTDPENVITEFGAVLEVQSHELIADVITKEPKIRMGVIDGTDTTNIILTPTSASLKLPRLAAVSEIATLFDVTSTVGALETSLDEAKADKFEDPTGITTDMWNMYNFYEWVYNKMLSLEGVGGALTAYNFTTYTPTQENLTLYACQEIWGAGGVFTWNGTTPSASTYVIGGVTRTAIEIFNATWVKNIYVDGTDPDKTKQNHTWQLVNTPDTGPAVFTWTDIGDTNISLASSTIAGVMKLFQDATGDASDGTMSQIAIKALAAEYAKKYNSFLNIKTSEELTATHTVTFDNTKEIYPITASGSLAASTITLAFPTTSSAESWTFELQLEVGATIPTITWDSTDTIKWKDDDVGAITYANKMTLFIFRKQGSVVYANMGGVF